MRVIYVAGPFRSKTSWGIHRNVLKAEEASLKLWKQGDIAICPHKMTEHYQGELPDKIWLDGMLEILSRCDAIYMLRGWENSEGSRQELELAEELGLKVIYE